MDAMTPHQQFPQSAWLDIAVTPCNGGGLRGSSPDDEPTLEPADDYVLAMMNALFAVGLDLMSVRAQIDGEAGTRLDRAIGDLDVIITRARTRASLLGYRPAGSGGIARW
jgi:hypothetical protein